MKKRLLKVKDLQNYYYTEDDRFYTTKEIRTKPVIDGKWIPYKEYDGKWIPYKEYIRVLIQLVKLKNKLIKPNPKESEKRWKN